MSNTIIQSIKFIKDDNYWDPQKALKWLRNNNFTHIIKPYMDTDDEIVFRFHDPHIFRKFEHILIAHGVYLIIGYP